MTTAIKSIGEVALRVNDLPVMIEFYESVVQLQLLRADQRLAFFKVSDGVAGHTQVLALFDRSRDVNRYVAPVSRTSTIDHIAFTIGREDFESENQRLLTMGVEVTYAYHEWVQWRSLYFPDPESNTIELVCHDPSGGMPSNFQ